MTTKTTNKNATNISEFYIESDRKPLTRGRNSKNQKHDKSEDAFIDYRFMIDIGYEDSGICMGENCGDGPCRCSTIEETRVDDDINGLFTGVLSYMMKKIKTKNLKTNRTVKSDQFLNAVQRYCIERLCVHHRVYDAELFDIDIVGGYYGEEIGSVTFENQKNLNKDIIYVLNDCKKDIDRIKYVLKLEYAYILDSIAYTTNVDIDWFNAKDIAKNSVELHRIKNNDAEYIFELDPKNDPIGIIHDNVLIDGHNRTKKVLQDVDSNKECCYIVLS